MATVAGTEAMGVTEGTGATGAMEATDKEIMDMAVDTTTADTTGTTTATMGMDMVTEGAETTTGTETTVTETTGTGATEAATAVLQLLRPDDILPSSARRHCLEQAHVQLRPNFVHTVNALIRSGVAVLNQEWRGSATVDIFDTYSLFEDMYNEPTKWFNGSISANSTGHCHQCPDPDDFRQCGV
ncbi:hypothetical protein DFH09DRAFT_1315935 [Mycena vulgaris]|nr:hypothetical protein DFH09DRAFT_1315935 [Mycena vulgaris]